MKIQFNQSLFDVSLMANGNIENVVQLALLNELGLNETLTVGNELAVFDGYEIAAFLFPVRSYDLGLKLTQVVRDRQSLFDISLMANGNIDNVVNLALLNELDLNETLTVGNELEVTKRHSDISVYIAKNKIIPISHGQIETGGHLIDGYSHYLIDGYSNALIWFK